MTKSFGRDIAVVMSSVGAIAAGVVLLMFIWWAISGCETGARHIVNKIVEEVTETDTLLVLPNGRPWQIVDSLHFELAGLRLQLAECEGN